MNRDEAISLLRKYVKNENLIKHCIASGAVMKKLAEIFNADKDKWEMAGILHDIDVELTKNEPQNHTKKAVEILKDYVGEDVIEAIKMHNFEIWGKEPSDTFHIALRTAETITGLIVASTLVLPDKKISSLSCESVLKRFKDKRFAQGARRDIILECNKIGILLEDFIKLSIEAMKDVSSEIGL